MNKIFIDRPPRIQPELPFDEIEIPAPPAKEQGGYQQLIQFGLPLMTIVGYVLISSMGGAGRSPLLLIPMALSVVASTGFAVWSYFKAQQKQAEIERAYEAQLVDLNKQMHVHHDMQRRFYHYNYPDANTVFRIVANTRRETEKTRRTLRSETRLWERRTTDDDFGVVRLGIGTLPSTVLYTLAQSDNFDDPQVREAMKLERDSQFVSNIPAIIALRQPFEEEHTADEEGQEEEQKAEEESVRRTPVTHSLGIAGETGAVYEYVRAMLAHYVVFHAPMDARLFVLATHQREWSWTDELPHCETDEQTEYRFFLDQIKPDDKERSFDEEDEGPLAGYLEGIRKILATRRIMLENREESEGKGDPTLPFLVVVVDLMDVASEDKESLFYDLESDAAIAILIEQGQALGAAVVFLVPERGKVPSGCNSVIEIEKTTPATNVRTGGKLEKLHFRYAEVGVNTFRYVGEADSVINLQHMETLAKELAQFDVRRGAGAGLASAVPFLDLYNYPSLHELQADVVEKWSKSTEPRYANWLRSKIGLMSGNKPRTLVFSAKRDGVHGMVAGSTGSGKSELLISMITGMAVTYDPSVLNFVLVDYKGGGAFKEYSELPHCVDIITNLDGDGVTRMFTAINAEMKRRQKLNADTSTKNIVEYRQKGLHNTHSPYPYLFIIIDEFAEMIADRAEFKGELETITRVGRAQGVSLLLAAQRPSGVTDQMRSNIKFRICLRVETPSESREMLRRTDAAFLPPGIPGRGYLQVGNEEIELVQVAYTGDKYRDPRRAPTAPVLWPDRGDIYDITQDQEPPELYKAIITLLNGMADDLSVPRQYAPWPDFLPKLLTLTQRLISDDPKMPSVTSSRYLADTDAITLGQPRPAGGLTLNPSLSRWLDGESGWVDGMDWENYAMRPVVGLVDNPYAARQLPLTIDLPRGHTVMFGASGWGKTTFIRTLAVSLAATHSPDHLHMYILDLGGRNLSALDALPHVGAVINPDEEGYKERVEQMLRELDDLVDRRKTILADAGAPDIYKYNIEHPEQALPAVLVAIDNFLEFKETFGETSDNVESVMDKFVDLARQAKPYGVHFVITINQLNSLSMQLYNVFTERLTLKLGDATDYRAIVGGFVTDLPDIPGRGYVKINLEPLGFQVAMPLDLSRRSGQQEPLNENKELERLGQLMQEYIDESGRQYLKPVRIDALPRSILFKQILARQHGLETDETFLGALKDVTRQQWANSIDPALADWLRVTIGAVSGNRLREMHLEAKTDGVHGLIAGGTGSGKSELLMTLIVGLALRYDPGILNFVLVDYKGGGAFAPFDNLPHVVDTVTNLNKAAVRRMFTSIGAEMDRRMKLCVDTSTSNIVEYRSKGLHLSHAPFPHLFIIIDEYAEMITDNPEFKDELDRITRVGRSIGVNLLLAAQRPVGVTDQMRANIKFRICLRVEGVDTSREMLRRSDAAFLPNGMPGRGYLQIGNDNIELMQVAYTGETYTYAEVMEGGKQPKFYDVAVNMVNELLAEAGRERPRTPWPPFLPAATPLDAPLVTGYLEAASRPLITLGRTDRLALNPFAGDWLSGKGQWPAGGLDWETTAMRAIVGILDDPYGARILPLVVDFTKGHAVLFGASGWGKTTFLRTLIASLAATHSPDEFQAHILDLGGRNLEVMKQLPHVGTVILPDERGYEERVQQLLREVNDIVDQRKRLFSEAGVATLYGYNSSGRPVEPAILLAIDNFAEYVETFGNPNNPDDENNLLSALVALARQAKAYGVHIVITANRFNVLTSKLYSLFTERLTLRLSDAQDYPGIVGAHIEVEEIPGRGMTRVARAPLDFQIALVPGAVDEQDKVRGEAGIVRELGARMRAYIEGSGHIYKEPLRIDALPKSSSYRQVLNEILELDPEEPFMSELERVTRQVWARNHSAEHADWLKATLGIASGMRKRTLSLEAKKDGVHGLIAGGTGSGKSEMLMTLICGLALNYPPDILNFVLVDYKGGGAFKPFERMPHVVDIVTNLNKAAVHRMFTAINAEIRRRQGLNANTGTKDIVDYRKRGLHLTGPAYPHLFIIIDEYAEMIDDNPEYRAELESITRVGRAQGVNLLLASQRPKGVTDQMRANIKLRLCLRVEQIDTSREMLRRPDAALLPNGLPGRGYLQIGNDPLELIQVSWTGETQPDDREPPVLWPQHEGAAPLAAEEPPKLYDAIANTSLELAGGQMAPKPWPAFLPTSISLQAPIRDAQRNRSFTLTTAVSDWLNGDTADAMKPWPGVTWRGGEDVGLPAALRPVAGLVDDPAEARQIPLAFDLSRDHLVAFGDSGWGKTSFLRTLITSLATTHSPNELHIYVLDLGGRNFRSLEELPHIGTVIYADEETFDERLMRLLAKLERLVDERQLILSDAAANNLWEFNERNPERAMPAVLVAIDNFAELHENYELLVDSTILPLIRRSLSAGVCFALTANAPNNMPSKLFSLVGQRVTFKQSNSDRYMDIVGRGALEIEDIPGRGYIRIGKKPLLFQAALPVGIFAADDPSGTAPSGRDTLVEADELRRLAGNMSDAIEAGGLNWQHRPDPIEILPEVVPLVEMLEQARPPKGKRVQAVLGQLGTLQPGLCDLQRLGPHFVIMGPPLSGKSTLLYNWIFSLADRYSPEEVAMVIVDTQRKLTEYGGEHTLEDLPHVLAAVSEPEALESLVEKLKAEGEHLAAGTTARELFVFIDNFDDFSEEVEANRTLPRDLSGLIRRYGGDGMHFVVAGTPDTGASNLKRQLMSGSYGLGLQSGRAVEALRVMRTPPSIRNKDLNVGRGFLVKSGQTTLIQAASPYEGMGVRVPVEDLDNDLEKITAALDVWVRRIVDKYPDSEPAWASGELPARLATVPDTARSAKMMRMLAVLQRALQQELSQVGDGNGNLVTAQLMETDIAHWQDESTVMTLLREVWRNQQRAQGLDDSMIDVMLGSFKDDDVLFSVESTLPTAAKPADEKSDGKPSR